MSLVPRRILPAIVVSQLAASSTWFAGNAVMGDLKREMGLPDAALGDVTTAVQLGFIAGTLTFAVLAISDRVSPRRLFLLCAWVGALANASPVIFEPSFEVLLALRFVVGFFLAGVYPVGMKIAAGWFDRELGKALGFLVGALVLGTALPHLVRALGGDLPWQGVLTAVSVISALGGIVMYALVPDGPRLRSSARFQPGALAEVFRSRDFRASSFGYFGHMWELYAFWAFVPAYLAAYGPGFGDPVRVALWTFLVIAAGAVGCISGGIASLRIGSARVAWAQLAVSAACCLFAPVAFVMPPAVALVFLIVWGVAVAGDSPQFSALNARFAPADRVGSALTIVNAIGFAITVVAIQLVAATIEDIGAQFVFLILLPGPLIGLAALRHLVRDDASASLTYRR